MLRRSRVLTWYFLQMLCRKHYHNVYEKYEYVWLSARTVFAWMKYIQLLSAAVVYLEHGNRRTREKHVGVKHC